LDSRVLDRRRFFFAHIMRIRSKLVPGQRGAQRLLAEYGDQLVCVRYRYDEQRQKRYKTIELIIDESDWRPPERLAGSRIVGLRIEWRETDLRKQVKQAGGKWNPDKRVWEMRYDRAKALGWEARIVEEGGL
jgi:hypothetical protein